MHRVIFDLAAALAAQIEGNDTMADHREFDIKRFKFRTWVLETEAHPMASSVPFDNSDDAIAAFLKAKKKRGCDRARLFGVTTTGHRQLLKLWTK